MFQRKPRPGNEQQSVKLEKWDNAFYSQRGNTVLQEMRGKQSLIANQSKIEFIQPNEKPQINPNTIFGCSNLNDLKSSLFPDHVKIFIQFFLLKGTCSLGYLKNNMRRVQYDGIYLIFTKEDVNPMIGTQSIKVQYRWIELISRYLPYLSANQIFLLTRENIIKTINMFLQFKYTRIKKMNKNITQRTEHFNPNVVELFTTNMGTNVSPLMLLYFVCIIFYRDIQSNIKKYLIKKGDHIMESINQKYIMGSPSDMTLEERILITLNEYKRICIEVYGNQIQTLSGGKKQSKKRLVDCTVKELKEKMKKKGKKLSKDGVPLTKSQLIKALKK